MADLEDQIFKQNIPGRYSSWWNNDCNEKNKGMGRNGGDSDSDCESTSNDSQPIKSIDESSSNNLYKNSCHRGGVKGVLEDYKLHRNHESNLLKEDAWTERNKISSGTGLTCEERSCSLPSLREQHRQQLLLSMDQKNNHHQTDVSGESSEEEEEDEFLKRYQAKRLDQWKETVALAAQHSDNLPLAFGEIAEVDPVRFAEIIDEEEESNVPVVIHMYENCIPACVAFNSHLESLARSMTYARFLRLRAFTAHPGFDKLALPVLMVYKNGQLIQNIVRVCDKFKSSSFTNADVKTFLESTCGLLPPISLSDREYQRRTVCSTRFKSVAADNDDLDAYCSVAFDKLHAH